MTKKELAIISGEERPDFGQYSLRLGDFSKLLDACEKDPENFVYKLVSRSFAIGFDRGTRSAAHAK